MKVFGIRVLQGTYSFTKRRMENEMKILAVVATVSMSIAASALERKSLDGLWEFAFAEGSSITEAKADFVAVDRMTVPGCYDLMPKWYAKRGLGSYRRAFTLEKSTDAAFLKVKGMGLRARFFIDGREVGSSSYPYLTFELPLGALAAGSHTIAVALDNVLEKNKHDVFQPYYDFYLSGGFYHGVEIVCTERPTDLDRVVVRTRDYKTGRVELTLEAKGKPLPASVMASVSFDGAAVREVEFKDGRALVEVPAFRLWSCESPNLHTVSVKTKDFGSATARFGIRDIKARGKKFYLNGKEISLLGVNRHESHPEFGYATDRKVMYRDIELMKSIGCNYVRGSHYPQAEDFLDLCDEMGLMVWEESLGWGNNAELDDPEFMRRQVEQTTLTVRQSINHPSVVISGFMNEFHSQENKGKVLADNLIAAIRAEDTGRLVTFACNHAMNDISNDNTDFITINRYPAWHGNRGTALTPESLHTVITNDFALTISYMRKRYGEDKPIIVGETGVYSIYGCHDPMHAQWSEEFQSEYLDNWLKVVLSSPEMAGFTVWQFCDSRTYFRGGSDIRTKPMAFNMAGLFDSARRAKLAAMTVKRHYEAHRK
jgi:beta-glucuronidase